MITSKQLDYDYTFKLMIIGDSSVGKTCLMLRFAERDVPKVYAQTIGIDFRVRTVLVDGNIVKLQIWDTAGQERFRTITSACYRGAAGVVFAYDITKRSTFNNISTWVQSFEKHATESKMICKAVVGNKCDLVDKREILPTEGKQMAEELDAFFVETSAIKNVNVEEMFMSLARRLIAANAPPTKTEDGYGTPKTSPFKSAVLTLKKSDLQHSRCCHH